MIGTTLGPYRLVEKLGTGGMGTVYLAEGDGQRVAVKILHPHLLEAPGALQRVRREAEAGGLVNHENVVRAITWDVVELADGPCSYLVTEYVEGRTLRTLLSDLGVVPEALLREIGVQVAAGLSAIHGEGIVHRDLKPENVMITADERVRIMDLGVARLVDATELTGDAGFAGSILYASPEQLRNASVGPPTDLYSLGVLLFELATGENPFHREEAARVISAHLLDEPPPATDRCPDLSLFVSDVIASLLEKDPADRFESAATLREVLDGGESSEWWSSREGAADRLPKVPVRKATRLLGREAEIGVLADAWSEAREGRGSALLLTGEAGIGKTRLIDGLFSDLRTADAQVLYGSYPPSGGIGGISGSILARFGAAGLEEALAPYLTSVPALVTGFAALLRRESLPPGSQLEHDALHEATCELMRGLAAQKPLLWVIEDLQFADPGSRKVVLSLARALEEHRVLLLLTARPELPADEIAHLSRLPNFRRLALTRLGEKDVVDLVREELRSDELAEKLGPKISEKSDGVPYFVLEILRGLREEEFISALPDGTHVETREVERIEVPSAVRDLILARLDELGEEERPLLELAAVLGFEFDPDLLSRVRDMERVKVLQRLASLERRCGLVKASGRAYRFDHHLIHELVYSDLPQGLREEYHTLLADAFGERAREEPAAEGEPAGDAAVFLASHHLKGGRPWASLSFLEPALEFLGATHRNDAVLELCELALESAGLLGGADRIEVLRRKAERLDLLGRFDDERETLTDAVRLADELGDPRLRAKARRLLASEANVLRDMDRITALLEEARSLAREAEDPVEEASTLGTLGSFLDRQGRFEEARELHERALELADGAGAADVAVKASGNLAHVAFQLGHFEEAGSRAADCMRRFKELGNRRGESATLGLMAGAQYELGHYDEAREYYERQLAIAREIGYRRGMAMATGNLGALDRAQGRYESALELFARDRTLSRDMGDVRGEAVNAGHLALTLLAIGDRDRARELWESALDSFKELRDRLWEGYALLWLGIIAEHDGNLDDAEKLCSEALAIWRDIKARSSTPDALIASGRIHLARGEPERAREPLDEALGVGREFRLAGAICRAHAYLALLPGGDAAAAVESLREHQPKVDHFEHLETRFALFRATRDVEHLDEAHRLLEELRDQAPPSYRETMTDRVPLLEAVRNAWEEHRASRG
ncbi:MAG: protein kinase domain-containing protein [Planctomycetota bacterium]